MEDDGKVISLSLLLAIVVAVLAVFTYNQIVVKPQIAVMHQQIEQLSKRTDDNTTILDKHTEAITSLSGTVDQNAQATDSLRDTVNNNANVANQNAGAGGY